MKHRRGVELDPGMYANQLTPNDDLAWSTFEELAQWYLLYARCGSCRRRVTLDRYELARKWGKRIMIISLSSRLRCTECGNRKGNNFGVAKLPR